MTSLSSGRGRRPSLTSLLLGGLGVVAAVCWPLLVYALLSRLTADPAGDATSGHVSPWVWALIALGALLIQRLPLPLILRLTLAALLIAISLLSEAELGLRAYPVLVNLAMLSVFATSLWRGMPVIERLARLQEPDLPAAGVRYTRKVTRVWCGFFVFNASVAAATALYADLATWTLYNGLVSYVLMGLLFCGEWLVRRRLRRADG
ncbi:hypothetical protein [Cobetia sp. 1AS1]|uniref:COG4648 family protein n=1 Tax=Cobetia sp. 1AS1 TaxID=3040016 RepID=UPI002446952B|nr:hypothetical protein [Cobetia sp. 1AS1]MDH2295860.1 hypothetical protein [Cobetia sp. 1AS1]